MALNDGKHLETLVKLIESTLIPNGFEIESREKVYNDAGVQIAEFDIVIKGKIGSAQFKGLIECRDRPSKGPAPTEWLEQLNGRRNRFNFSKVMAVSSTGFTEGAKEEAKRTGIDIRTMDNLNYQSVMNWLPLNAPIIINRWLYSGVCFHIGNIISGNLDSLNTKLKAIYPQAQIIYDKKSGNTLSIDQIWQSVLNKNKKMFNGLIPNDKPKIETITEFCEDMRYEIRIDSDAAMLVQIDFSANLSVERPHIPLTEIYDYKNPNGKSIATIAKWQAKKNGPFKEITFIGYPKASE